MEFPNRAEEVERAIDLTQLLDQAIKLDPASKETVQSIPVVGIDNQILGVLSTHSTTIRWDWERDNTRHIAADSANILGGLRPVLEPA